MPWNTTMPNTLCSFFLTLAVLVPTLRAQLPPVPVPPENPITEAKRVLGKILFWEEQLSSDNTVACGTCHLPAFGGSDPRLGLHPGPDQLAGTEDDIVGSPGVIRSDASNGYVRDSVFGLTPQVTGRNSQHIIGSQWADELFWDGRAASEFRNPANNQVSIVAGGAFENQVTGPPLSDVEMAHEQRSWTDIIAKLQTVDPLRLATNVPADMAAVLGAGTGYPDLFNTAFGDNAITAERIAFSIATYERTLVADQTPYDLGTMTQNQAAGHDLLLNHTVCFNCHVPPLFTDNEYYNIGLRPAAEDIGRMAVTNDPNDNGRFKTPTLRNIGLKTSMMHVGWITSVQDSIDFYNAPAWPAVSAEGFTQFTADQSGIPTGNPNFFANYQNINMPASFQPAVINFLENALTDPRVANETFPFDRPTLHSELVPGNPTTYGVGSAGTGGFTPAALGVAPLVINNTDMKIGLQSALGGSLGVLFLSAAAAPANTWFGQIPIHVDPGQLFGSVGIVLAGAGGGDGYGMVPLSIANNTALIGLPIYGQWIVWDPIAPDGLASSGGMQWTVR